MWSDLDEMSLKDRWFVFVILHSVKNSVCVCARTRAHAQVRLPNLYLFVCFHIFCFQICSK